MEIETQLHNIFKDALKTDIIVEVFSGFVSMSQKDHEMRMRVCINQFKTFYNSQADAERIASIKMLIKFIHQQKIDRQASFLFDFLETCIQDGFLPPKSVIENLQTTDLVYTRKLHWLKTYSTIRKFIHLVDYKGCRNVVNQMIFKMRDIPVSAWNTAKQQVDSLCKMLEHVLDPEANLLPGYLAVNEIRQTMPEEQLIAPWAVLEKLTAFVDRFHAVANMVSTTGRWMILPVVNNTFHQVASIWKLEPESLRFPLKRQLPYCKEMYQRQWRLLRYVLKQAHSREMVQQILGIQKHQKQRYGALETELVELMLSAINSTEEGEDLDTDQSSHLLWLHLSGQVVYFVFRQHVSITHMVEALHVKLSSPEWQNNPNLSLGRHRLMWVLLQFIGGSIQKNSFSDFHPVIKLINLLYPEPQPFPLTEMNKPSSVINFSAMCILMHLSRKTQNKGPTDSSANTLSATVSDSEPRFQIPIALQKQHQFLKQCLQMSNTTLQDFRIALVCNAIEQINSPIAVLVDSIFGDTMTTFAMPGSNCVACNKVVPLSMELLDSLTAHAKMSMLHQIGVKIQNVAQSKSSFALSPAVVETYSRLLVYTEIDSLGTKGLVNQILPTVANESRSWQVLHTLLEMISYRMHHIQTAYRIQLLTTLHGLSSSPQVNHRQLHLRIESTALRLIMGFDNFDISPQLVRLFGDQKQIVSRDSEELNRVLVLTLARSIYITGAETISGSWCTDILKAVMAATPHRWPQKTLACFPRSMQSYFHQHSVEGVNKTALRDTIDEELPKWLPLLTGMGESSYTENDMMTHFSNTKNPYFICLLWKVLFEGKNMSMFAYKVLEQMAPSQLSSHVRTFSDFLISEFSVGDGGDHLKVCADLLRDMVWKYNIVFLDRLILCLALRSSEPDEIQVAFFIIQYLLIKPEDFRNRVHHFVQEVDDIDHWTQNDWHSKHMSYHQKFSEMHYFEGLLKHCSGAEQLGDAPLLSSQQYLPAYFSNITLRFLPVLDVVIHRCLELLPSKSLEILLDHLGLLYKFHDQPISYLFNTLHYYEAKLRDSPTLKKQLVSTIIGAITENKPAEWALSEEYVNRCLHSNEQWQPTSQYYCSLVKRLVDSIADKKPAPFTPRDWRFNEFPNACAHALQVTCVEALALPVAGEVVGQALMDVVLKSQPSVSREDSLEWMNATALILTALPEVYWKPLHRSILQMIECDNLTSEIPAGSPYPYHVLTYSNQQMSYSDMPCTRLLALTHIVWHHMNIGQLSLVSQFLKDEIRPIVKTELQMLYVFHLIGPYIPRYQLERTRCMMDVALVLYHMLLQVSKHSKEIRFVDEIADFLYHVKYMHIGVLINDKIEDVVVQLQPTMRRRLRFMTHAQQSTGRTQQVL